MNRPTAAPRTPTHRVRRTVLRSWRQLALTLPADAPELLGPLRKLVVRNLVDWGADPASAADIEVSVSELATNALRYSDGPVRVQLTLQAGMVQLEVSDTSTDAFGQTDGLPDDEHGRGLHIVKHLACTLEVRLHRWGKTVVASFEIA